MTQIERGWTQMLPQQSERGCHWRPASAFTDDTPLLCGVIAMIDRR